MRDEQRDILRLEHIREAIEKLLQASSSPEFYNLTDKDLSYFGIVKLLEIIGEASYKLTNRFKELHPETPWRYVVGMRHVLVHGYYQINREDIFKTIREDLPILRDQIEKYISMLLTDPSVE